MSFNTKVLVSKNVGAKDLLSEKSQFLTIEEIPNIIAKQTNSPVEKVKLKEIKDHVIEMRSYYEDVMTN